MSASFTRRAKYLTFAGLATIGLAAAAQIAVTPLASAEDPYTVPLNNTDTEDNSDCPQGPTAWGYHFVLPSNTATFVTMTVTFDTGLGTQVTLTAPPAGFVDGKHAWVYAPGDYSIVSGSAVVVGGDIDKVVFSHYCAGVTETTPPTTAPPTTQPPTTQPPTTQPPTTQPPTTQPPTTQPPTTQPPTTQPPTTQPPTTQPPTTQPPTTVPPTTEVPSESPSETPSAEVSGTVIESPSESPSESTSPTPTVLGERATRGPAVLPTTGNVLPVSLLLLLGFGLVGAGVVATVAGEAPAATEGGKHRR